MTWRTMERAGIATEVYGTWAWVRITETNIMARSDIRPRLNIRVGDNVVVRFTGDDSARLSASSLIVRKVGEIDAGYYPEHEVAPVWDK